MRGLRRTLRAMNWIIAWILAGVAFVGAAVTLATAIAGMGLPAVIAGVITLAAGVAVFAAEAS